MKLLVKTRTSHPLIAVDLWLRAGAREERRGENGSAHFLEHAVFKGTESRPSGESDAAVENLGATFNAATGPDYVHFYTTVSSRHLSKALEILSDIVRNATLPDPEIERERGVILSELAQRDADPTSVLIGKLYLTGFASHPYSHPPGGEQDGIRIRARDTLANFYSRQYNPDRATLVIVGDCSFESAQKACQGAFGSWKRSSEAAYAVRPEASVPAYSPFRSVEVSRIGVGAVGFAFPAPVAKDFLDACVGQVVAAILGDSEFGGRLATPGLKGSAVQVSVTPRMDTSLMSFTATLATRTTVTGASLSNPGGKTTSQTNEVAETSDSRNLRLNRLEEALASVLQNMRDHPPLKSEVEAAKQRVLGSLIFSQETDAGCAAAIGYSYLVGGDGPEAFRKRLQQVSVQDVDSYIHTYLSDDLRSTIVLN